MEYKISNGKYSLSVSKTGAELISAKLASGFEIMWQNDKNFWNKHAPLLFPICGRIKDGKYTVSGKEYKMRTHGFVSTLDFELVEKSDDKLILSAKSDEATLAEYPFEFEFSAQYELCDDGIVASFKITNKSNEEMPYMFGWHPGFAYPKNADRLEDFTLDFGNCDSLKLHPLQHSVFVNPVSKTVSLDGGKYKIDSKFLYENDTIIFSDIKPSVKLSCGDYELDFSFSDNLPYLCIWKQPNDEARFLCLEPWSSVPGDGENDENFDTRAMLRLTAGKTETFVYKIKVKH